MSIYNLSSSSTSSLDSCTSLPSSTPESVLALYPTSDFMSPPSGAALPVPGPRRPRSASFGERRGHQLSIQINTAKPIGEVAVAKGHLEPRAGALPRRPRRKQPEVAAAPEPVRIEESQTFNLFVGGHGGSKEE
ncbi:hypothetical protein E1B28_009739 [Marasmius oreades]|uniref:Uncharacterized protein n=1 Tax=Marasmius oreades TaxID=181124 RepID=A0A9P7RWD1_9AGAR|nr:uncharacterized protein E1B28_009739 [Marasmius oreades]KAG7090637.1 hypothetical protein E1B28_009739 [Marasmius oreades]